MKNVEKGYYVILPTWLFDDDKIPWSLKRLYGIISSLAKKEGFCWASNKWLAEQLKISDRTVQRYLKKLKDWKLIDVEIDVEAGNERRITIGLPYGQPLPQVTSEMSCPHDKAPKKLSLGNDKDKSGAVARYNNDNVKINNKLRADCAADVSTSAFSSPSKSKKVRIPSSSRTREVKGNPEVKKLINTFKEYCQNLKGFEPDIDWPKDGAMAKRRLQQYGFEKLTDLLDWFLSTEISERLPCSLSVALSTNVINIWLRERAKENL